jgi:hypothetical protein
VSLDCKDASQLADRQCIGSQGKMIDLNLTTSISSDDGLSLLLLDVSAKPFPADLPVVLLIMTPSRT